MDTLKWRLIRMRMRARNHFHHALGSFHETRFTFKQSWHMGLTFAVLYYIGANVMNLYLKYHAQKTITGQYMVLNFLVMELLPILLIGLWFGVRSLRKHGHKNVLEDIGHEFKKWVKRFAVDLWRHKALILGTVVIIFIAEIILNKFASGMAGVTSSPHNNQKIIKLLRQSAWMLFAVDIIAPLTEELFFRFWMPKFIGHMINHAWSEKLPHMSFLLGAIISALFFAMLHVGSQPYMAGSFIVMALTLQWLERRTHSLTAPALVHILQNAIVTGATLL